ncbi:hypothetical protein OKW36_001130 [Paraburkholderia sp. MM5482-R1]
MIFNLAPWCHRPANTSNRASNLYVGAFIPFVVA